MADSTLTLVLRVRDETKAMFARVHTELEKLREAQRKQRDEAEKASGKGVQGFVGMGRAARLAAQEIGSAGEAIRNIGTAIAAGGLIAMLKGFVDTAARTEVLGTVLTTVAKNAGITSTSILALDKKVQGLGITAAASREGLTQFIQAGLDISKAGELARAAQDLAVIAGEDSSTVFSRVITNIQQMDQQGLRYNGVVLNMDEVTKAYARTIGKTADELSTTERQQAVLNGVLQKASEITGVYEKSMNDVGKQVSSLKRLNAELSESLGKNLLPAYRVLVEEYTLFLKQANKMAEATDANGEGAKTLADQIKPLAEAVRKLSLLLLENIDTVFAVAKAYIAFKVVTSVLGTAVQTGMNLAAAGKFLKQAWDVKSWLPATIAWFKSVGVTMLSIATGAIPKLIAGMKALGVATLALVKNPWVLALLGLAAAVTATAAVLSRGQPSAADKAANEVRDPSDSKEIAAKKALARLVIEQNHLLERQQELREELRLAESTGNTEHIQMVKGEIKANSDRQKAAAEEKKLLMEKNSLTDESLKKAEEEAAATRAKLEETKKLKEVQEALGKFELDTTAAYDGKDIDKGFSEKLGALNKLFDDFGKKGVDETGKLRVSFGQLSLATSQMVEQAKTFDEVVIALAKARQLLDAGGKTSNANAAALEESAAYRLQETAVKDLEKALSGYLGKQKEASETAALFRQVATDSQGFITSIRQTIAEFGKGLSVAEDGIVTFNQSAQSIAGTATQLAALDRDSLRTALESVKSRYLFEQEQIESKLRRQKEIIESEVQSEDQKNIRLKAVEQAANRARLENSKTLYADLKREQESYAAKIKESAQKIAELDKQIRGSKKSEAQDLFNLEMKGLSEQEQVYRRQEQLTKALSDARLAASQKDYALAQETNSEAMEMARTMASSAQTEDERYQAAEKLKEVYSQQREILAAQKKEEQERQQFQVNAMNELTTALAKTAETFSTLTQGKGLDMTINLHREQLDKALEDLRNASQTKLDITLDSGKIASIRQQLQDGLQGINVSLNANVSGRGYSSGGKIVGPGTGTSDDVLMFGSNGEWVIKEQAAKYYGEEFMDKLNNMELPKAPASFAKGGPISGMTRVGPAGGGTTDRVAVDLNIGGEKVSLFGERNQVNKFVKTLRKTG